jgi:hypothetical protein
MRRQSYLKHDEVMPLGKRGLTIWAYGRNGRFACRIEVNAADVAVYAGTKGKKRLANVSWKNLCSASAGSNGTTETHDDRIGKVGRLSDAQESQV